MSDEQTKGKGYDLWTESELKNFQARPSFWTEFKQRMLEDPGVPVFSLLTVGALLGGMNQSFFKRDPAKANLYMTARVGFQGAAALALIWSITKMLKRDQENQ